MEIINHFPSIYIICGKARHGKNTVGDIIKRKNEENGIKTIKLQFSFYLKEYTKNIIGWDGKEETKPRAFLQDLGTELVKKKIDSQMLIRRIIEDIKIYSYFYDSIIINDARFPEEIENIKNNFENVKVIRVIRTLNEKVSENDNHLTETALDNYNNYDYVIYNDKDIKELENKVFKLFSEVSNNE